MLNRFVVRVTAEMYLFLETCDQQIRPFFRLLRAHRRPMFSDEPSSRTTIYQFVTCIRHRYVAIYERRLARQARDESTAATCSFSPVGEGRGAPCAMTVTESKNYSGVWDEDARRQNRYRPKSPDDTTFSSKQPIVSRSQGCMTKFKYPRYSYI